MGCSKNLLIQILDSFLLSLVFIFQSVVLSQYLVYNDGDLGGENGHDGFVSYEKILWLIGDLICLTLFLLSSICGYKNLQLARGLSGELPRAHGSTSLINYVLSSKLPLFYVSWFCYAMLLVTKITVIFTSNLHEKPENFGTSMFGAQMLQLVIGISAIIFSLLVEAHHDARRSDPKRNAYLNSLAYGIALEILDTADFLSFLIPSFEHSHHSCPTSTLAPVIISLASVNLVLPTLTLYKLTTTSFGEVYQVKLEILYDSLHNFFVSIPFLVIRIYLWNVSEREDVLFAIKNIYCIVGYCRGLFSNVKHLRSERRESCLANADANK
ncbi:hypothetical protein Ocin01_15000 [Orchesella cincta]|uniref:Uncharacterized protein n=1 Tax=Orchesella cincta TaxID=48709 RepID=A0A1D2MFB6_ORCCI|nr:hypothetical protein Ocin01_15000 [Orchesella cincta]